MSAKNEVCRRIYLFYYGLTSIWYKYSYHRGGSCVICRRKLFLRHTTDATIVIREEMSERHLLGLDRNSVPTCKAFVRKCFYIEDLDSGCGLVSEGLPTRGSCKRKKGNLYGNSVLQRSVLHELRALPGSRNENDDECLHTSWNWTTVRRIYIYIYIYPPVGDFIIRPLYDPCGSY